MEFQAQSQSELSPIQSHTSLLRNQDITILSLRDSRLLLVLAIYVLGIAGLFFIH